MQNNNIENAKNKLKVHIDMLREIVMEKFGIEVPVIYVKFNLKDQTTLGAIKSKRRNDGSFSARLNLELLVSKTNLYLNEVVTHEVAHVVTRLKYGDTVNSHGKEWKEVARTMGMKNPKSTTDVFSCEDKPTKKKRFEYSCGCQISHFFTARRHNNAQDRYRFTGKQMYKCPKCHKNLSFKEEHFRTTHK